MILVNDAIYVPWKKNCQMIRNKICDLHFVLFSVTYIFHNCFIDPDGKWYDDRWWIRYVPVPVKQFWKIWVNDKHQEIALGWYHVTHSIKSLWPRDAIWPHRSESTLAQGMACYLNQFGPLINGVLWYSLERIFALSGQGIMLYNEFEIIHFRLLPYLPGASDLMHDIIHGTSVTVHRPWRLMIIRLVYLSNICHSCWHILYSIRAFYGIE